MVIEMEMVTMFLEYDFFLAEALAMFFFVEINDEE